MKLPTPPSFKHISARIPAPLAALPLLALLDLARKRRWLQAPAELDGRSFAIHVRDLGLQARFHCRGGRFLPQWQGPAELELTADALDFLRMAKGEVDADTLFFQRKLSIAGDTELGLLVKNWLDASERPSWLSKLPAIAPN